MSALLPITANPLAEISWALRWDACKGTAWENACLVSFTDCGDAELECHATVALDDPDARAEAIGYIEDLFDAWDALPEHDTPSWNPSRVHPDDPCQSKGYWG